MDGREDEVKTVLTDEDLMAGLREGLSSAQIAQRHGVGRRAVTKRRRRLRFQATTIAVMAKPAAQQLVSDQQDAIELLQVCMQRLSMMSDAYHEWLLDPKDKSKYSIGPRSTEIEVVYSEPGSTETSKTTLQALLDRIEKHVAVRTVERRCADPRAELRGTVNTIASTVSQMVELAAMLADVRSMQALRDIILEELRSVDEALAARVISKFRSHLVVGGVPYGAGAADVGNRSGSQRV